MYKLHLILKYLRKRRIAWVSLIAVMLCTAMVLVVISVMGGWLRMFEDSFRKVSGDIVITSGGGLRGFGYYDRMIPLIEQLPDVQAAVPVIQAYGLLNIGNSKSEGVQVIGYPMDKIGKVNHFPQSLYFQYRQYIDAANAPGTSPQRRAELLHMADESAKHASFDFSPFDKRTAELFAQRRKGWPGMILGSGLLEIRKDREGKVIGREMWKYELPATLVVFDAERQQELESGGAVSRRPYNIVDDSHTGTWQYDSMAVYVPFDVAQLDMGMAPEPMTTEQGKTITRPARTHEVHVRVRPGVELEPVRQQIEKIVDDVLLKARQENEAIGAPISWTLTQPTVQTWREKNAVYLSAVENEKVLVVFLFSMISVVAVFLIFCIFYMIVVEKTKDIGIIKSVGATGVGVAGIFLGYGAAIGMVGGGLGFLAGYFIVSNINALHAKLGQWMGIQVWNPEVYVFDTIPSDINPREAIIIVAVAVGSSILGSVLPAIRAARLNPVEAVRYE